MWFYIDSGVFIVEFGKLNVALLLLYQSPHKNVGCPF